MSSPKVSLPAGSSYPDAEGMQFTACQGALLSNDPDKAAQLEALGITVVGRRRTGVFAGEANRRYLETKVSSTGHTIHLPLPLLAA